MSKSKFSDDPKAMHFQIRFTDKSGCGSFCYFSALSEKEIGPKAEETANEQYLQRGYDNAQFRSFGYFKPMRSAQVVQYDRAKQQALKGGIKFKIRLSFFQATYMSGRKERSEWYKADKIESPKKKPLTQQVK